MFILVAFIAFGSTSVSRAEAQELPGLAGSPFDLVNAVNALRASFGLAPYSINSILMSSAQAQADFLAAAKVCRLRLLWIGDSTHLNTMVSQNLTEIGAGVAISAARVYYVIDGARPTTSGEPQTAGIFVEGESAVPEISAVIIPVSVSTPNTEGNVIHEVKPGQTLWQIAITYEVKIDGIKRLNNLFDNNIYPGNKLLIMSGVVVPTGSPTETPMQIATSTSMPTLTSPARNATSTFTPIVASTPALTKNTTMMKVVISIIALALLGEEFLPGWEV